MEHVVPPSLLFDFQLAIPRCESPQGSKAKRLLNPGDGSQLFLPAVLNEQKMFADVRAGWNDEGIAVSVRVHGKPDVPDGASKDMRHADAVLLWLDTRPAANVHRATEYCHHFGFLPADNENDGAPSACVLPIAQQRLQRIDSDVRRFQLKTHITSDGYELEIWIPGSQLHGFREIAQIGRIGFSCIVQDSHLGQQHMFLDENFPVTFDPSLWLPIQLLNDPK
ncbi:MAG: hypothetical protein R3C49_03340 [Planctomycetaceae bacterium]